MLTNNSKSWIAIGLWFVGVVVILGGSVAVGARPFTITLLVPLCVAPLAIALWVSKRTQMPTLAESIHAVNISKDGR